MSDIPADIQRRMDCDRTLARALINGHLIHVPWSNVKDARDGEQNAIICNPLDYAEHHNDLPNAVDRLAKMGYVHKGSPMLLMPEAPRGMVYIVPIDAIPRMYDGKDVINVPGLRFQR